MKKVFNFILTRCHLSYYILLLSKNRINLFLTFYVNFKFLPFKQAIKFPIYIYHKTKFLTFQGEIILKVEKVSKGMIKFGRTNDSVCPSGGITEIINYATIIFKGKADIGCGCRILTYNKGNLIFGNNFKMNNQNMLGCCNNITIGDSVIIAHQVQIFDTDFHFIYNFMDKTVKNNTKPVFIGKNCWIGNRVTIMKGTKIPNFTIISANSMLNKEYEVPEGSILVGSPARCLDFQGTMIRNQEIEVNLYKYFKSENKDKYFFEKNISLNEIINLN